MNNLEVYKSAFKSTLMATEQELEGLKYQDIEGWDSVGHMALMAELEDVFNIEMDIDDIIDFSSFEVGIEILSKYKVEME